MNMSFKKYQPYPSVDLPQRQWPNKKIEKAPIWCSVDLRDGNQALPIPMNVEEKMKFFQMLCDMGFKEIEVGFPSASNTEYDFLRKLIEEDKVPDDVVLQVLTQSREHLIRKTFEAIDGAKNVIVHLYNSTSVQQRKVVFNKGKKEIIEIAEEGAKLFNELAKESKVENLSFEYSPESFTGTELDFALEICEAVLEIWEPTKEKPAIINLPATVEMATPNVFADQVEWFLMNLKNRESVILSVHAHNDRGTAVAATELALLAGADRVEGTLFGNGERTGNVDILTLGMNMYSQGIDPQIAVNDVNKITDVYEECTRMKVGQRHPYAGELVYTAFSGSHQDAIKKGLAVYEKEKDQPWEVPYLPIDPSDIGRQYEPIIRINSQSGKGGVAYILEAEYGYRLPKGMQPEFGTIIKDVTDETGKELTPNEIYSIFKEEYIDINTPLALKEFESKITQGMNGEVLVEVYATVLYKQQSYTIEGKGNGPIDAFFDGVKGIGIPSYELVSYDEHSLQRGSSAEAICYIGMKNGVTRYGVGRDHNIDIASIKAIISGLNRLMR